MLGSATSVKKMKPKKRDSLSVTQLLVRKKQRRRKDYFAGLSSAVKSHMTNFMLFVAEEELKIES